VCVQHGLTSRRHHDPAAPGDLSPEVSQSRSGTLNELPPRETVTSHVSNQTKSEVLIKSISNPIIHASSIILKIINL